MSNGEPDRPDDGEAEVNKAAASGAEDADEGERARVNALIDGIDVEELWRNFRQRGALEYAEINDAQRLMLWQFVSVFVNRAVEAVRSAHPPIELSFDHVCYAVQRLITVGVLRFTEGDREMSEQLDIVAESLFFRAVTVPDCPEFDIQTALWIEFQKIAIARIRASSQGHIDEGEVDAIWRGFIEGLCSRVDVVAEKYGFPENAISEYKLSFSDMRNAIVKSTFDLQDSGKFITMLETILYQIALKPDDTDPGRVMNDLAVTMGELLMFHADAITTHYAQGENAGSQVSTPMQVVEYVYRAMLKRMSPQA